jgi:predicted TIM-barrel fold metal-dependent hydrolase
VGVHCGVWKDFRTQYVMNFFETLERFEDVHFDLFHMGMPAVREMAFVGKNLPNVSLNLCWSPIVSQHMMESALQEYLDLVPTSKIIGFGGDYHWNPELTFGHLQMARESLARVFAARIKRGMIDFDGAVAVLHAWLYDNPKRIYAI